MTKFRKGDRVETPFTIMIVSPVGVESAFTAWHEPSVDHRVRRKP